MFVHHCTSCDGRELIFPDQITGLVNDDQSFRIEFTCWCEAPQSHRIERELAAA